MQCKNIILMAFYHGDQDQELSDNVSALEKKYAGKMKGMNAVDVVSAHVTEGSEDKEKCLKLFKEAAGGKYEALTGTNDNGLYLIIHAGPTRSNPEAKILAEIVGKIVNEGVRFRKINLAGCYTGGNKLSKSTVDKSVLSVFCDSLVQQFTSQTLGLLNETSVCAYQTEVTTFDEESKYFNFNLTKYKKPEGLTGIHNVVQDSKAQTLTSTHPQVTGQNIEELLEFHEKRYGEIEKTPPIRKIVGYGEKKKEVKNLPIETQKKYFQTYESQRGVVDKNKKDEPGLTKQLDELVKGFDRYIRTKLVYCFDAGQRKFVPGSLSDYTDNEDVRRMVTFLEGVKGPVKLVFHL